MLKAMVQFDATVKDPRTGGRISSIFGIWENGYVRGISPVEWENREQLYLGVPVLVSKSAGDLTHLASLDNAVKDPDLDADD